MDNLSKIDSIADCIKIDLHNGYTYTLEGALRLIDFIEDLRIFAMLHLETFKPPTDRVALTGAPIGPNPDEKPLAMSITGLPVKDEEVNQDSSDLICYSSTSGLTVTNVKGTLATKEGNWLPGNVPLFELFAQKQERDKIAEDTRKELQGALIKADLEAGITPNYKDLSAL